jgi:hypothetical protein
VDLPTYTNIWRIEKRLYKLYDFRLPMPLPINWIAVFAGITIPYIVLLIAIGLPFNHTLVWLYVLPPGLITWLTTRPVIENKRLPELVESQVRYMAEPRTWVRFAPLTEKEQMVVTARVWHSSRPAVGQATENDLPAAVGQEGSGAQAPRTPSRAGRPASAGQRARSRLSALGLGLGEPQSVPVREAEASAAKGTAPIRAARLRPARLRAARLRGGQARHAGYRLAPAGPGPAPGGTPALVGTAAGQRPAGAGPRRCAGRCTPGDVARRAGPTSGDGRTARTARTAGAAGTAGASREPRKRMAGASTPAAPGTAGATAV